jgi:hypothetical protein
MMMKEDVYEFVQTVHVGHPYYLPNFMDGLTYSLPFVMENLSRLAEDIITICLPKADEDVPEDEQEEVERLRGKILALSRLRHVMGGLGEDRRQSIQQVSEIPAVQKGIQTGQLAKFEAALQMDFMKEYLKPGAQLGSGSTKAPMYRGRSKSLNFLDMQKTNGGRAGGGGGGPPKPNFLIKKDASGATKIEEKPEAGAGAGEARGSGRRERAKAMKFVKPPSLGDSTEGAEMSKKEKRRSKDDWSIGK